MISKQEFAKAMIYLGTTYGKEITKEQMKIWYEHLNHIDYQTLIKTIKNLAIKNKYIPSIAELIEESNQVKNNYASSILKTMYDNKYFHKGYEDLSEEHAYMNYEKATNFVKRGIIPKWLEEDMKEYQITYEGVKLIQ